MWIVNNLIVVTYYTDLSKWVTDGKYEGGNFSHGNILPTGLRINCQENDCFSYYWNTTLPY